MTQRLKTRLYLVQSRMRAWLAVCMLALLPACDVGQGGQSEGIVLAAGHVSPIGSAGRKAARSWLDRQGIDFPSLKDMTPSERAARLNQAVYDYCENGHSDTPTDLNDLYETCATACGGISYVLRGLLEATGDRTRYAHLYNIPNQGNHTAVEVDLGNGHWGFFDPTFGVYFTQSGLAGGEVLSLADVSGSPSETRLSSQVLQAPDQARQILVGSLEALYEAQFDHLYMSLKNYMVAEALSYDDPREWIVLDIDLRLEEGRASLGDFEARDVTTLSAGWLADTNEQLLNSDLTDDVSYYANRLWANQSSLTTVSISNLSSGSGGTVTLLFWNPVDISTDLQILPLGKTARFETPRILSIPPGRSEFSIPYIAEESIIRFGLKNLGDVPFVHLFGITALAD